MKLKVKNLNWLAGRPVVVLDRKTAKKLNVHVDERVELIVDKRGKNKFHAVVDIFPRLVGKNEIGVSNEISKKFKIRDGSKIDVNTSEASRASYLINKKLSGEELSKEELDTLVSDIVQNNLTEAEIAFFAAAEKAQGMSLKEIVHLVEAMVDNGKQINFRKKIVADKHCIGGIAGNRTTPIVVSICAAAGLTIPKTSSRAITSASGTADVIETISNVEFSPKELKKVVSKTNACLAWGGSLGLAPSDDKIIRVERTLKLDIEPQLIASILSKKISAGATHVLIDIPYGKSAKAHTKQKAKELGNKFKKIAKKFRIKLDVIYTDGNQPIGNGIGPILEMFDVIKVLKEPSSENVPKDLLEKSILLSERILRLCKINNPKQRTKEILYSGEAYEKFKEIINVQNSKDKKSKDFENRVSNLKLARLRHNIVARRAGNIKEIDNKKINSLARILGTPETKSAGVYLHKHLGKIAKGEKILTLYSESNTKLNDGLKFIKEFKPFTIK